MKRVRRYAPALILAVLMVAGAVGPASGAAASFGDRFDNQVRRKLASAGIINTPGNPVHWTKLIGVPDVFADGADNGLTDINDCPAGSAIRVIHGDATVECLTAGDITKVTAGDGLTGGGETGDVSVAVDYTKAQKRVAGTCTAGNSIREIKEDGTVTCEADDKGALAAGRVLENGSVGAAGTANWTSAFATDHYEITLTGLNYSINDYAAFITPIYCGSSLSAVTYRVDAVSGKVGVYFYKAVDQTAAQCQFHFQVIDI